MMNVEIPFRLTMCCLRLLLMGQQSKYLIQKVKQCFYENLYFDNRFGWIRAEVDPENGAEADENVDQASQV